MTEHPSSSRGLLGRVEHLRHEAIYAASVAVARWQRSSDTRRKRRHFRSWLAELRAHPPDVLLGANIDRQGGIRHHLQGIQQNSSLRVELAPPDRLMEKLTYHDLHTTLRDDFFRYEADGIRAIHSHVYPYFLQWSSVRKGFPARWIHTYHAPYLPEYADGDLAPWQEEINRALATIARHADVRVSVSRWQQKYLEESAGIETVHIPNGVDIRLCEMGDADRFRLDYGEEPFIAWVGRNDPVKNPKDFVRLAQHLPDLKFLMIGEGLSAAQLQDELNIVAPSNLSFRRHMSRARVQDALAACAALVVTSLREGFPTIVLEGLAQGKPIVVPNDPGCVEALGGTDYGEIYEHGNLRDLSDKLLKVLDDTDDRVAHRRHRVRAEFDWRVIAPRLDALYNGASA